MPPHMQRTTTQEWRRLMLRQKPHVPHTDIQAALMAAHSHQLPKGIMGSHTEPPLKMASIHLLTTGTFQSVHTSTLAFLTLTRRQSAICEASGKRLMPAVTRRLKHSYTLRPKRYALSTTTPAMWMGQTTFPTARPAFPKARPKGQMRNSFRLPLRRRTTSTPCTQPRRKRRWRR